MDSINGEPLTACLLPPLPVASHPPLPIPAPILFQYGDLPAGKAIIFYRDILTCSRLPPPPPPPHHFLLLFSSSFSSFFLSSFLGENFLIFSEFFAVGDLNLCIRDAPPWDQFNLKVHTYQTLGVGMQHASKAIICHASSKIQLSSVVVFSNRSVLLSFYLITTSTHTHARTHTRTHARTHAHIHTHTELYVYIIISRGNDNNVVREVFCFLLTILASHTCTIDHVKNKVRTHPPTRVNKNIT